MKRAALAASTLSLLSLTTLTACGGDTDSATGEPAPTTSQAKQITPAQRLEKIVITTADIGRAVEKPSAKDDEYVFAKSQDDITVDKQACAPLAYAMNQLPLGEPQADLNRHISGGYGNTSTYITLMTYDTTDKAESALAGLSKAVDSCGGGFTAKAKDTSTYGSVTAEKPLAPAGDQSLAFRATFPFRGVTHIMHGEAVRSGDVIAVYFSANGFAIIDDRPSDAKLPAAVVKAQNAKLG